MEMLQEAGIPKMHILQGATEWPSEAMHLQDRLGSVTPGKLADILIINSDPLKDIANLRDIDTLVFDGKIADREFHASYATTFLGAGTMRMSLKTWLGRKRSSPPLCVLAEEAARFPSRSFPIASTCDRTNIAH